MNGNVINVDAMDRELFETVAEKSEVVEEVLERSDTPSTKDLLTDAFGAFYKWAPELKSEVPSDRHLNRKVMEQMMATSEYKTLRHFSVGDEINAAGSLRAVQRVFDSLPQELKDHQHTIESARQEIQDFINDNDLSNEDVKDELRQLIEALEKKCDTLDAMAEESGDLIRQLSRSALEEAAHECETAQAALIGFGCGTDEASLGSARMADRIRIGKLLRSNPAIARIMDLAGKLVRIARRKQAEKEQYARQEVSGVTIGADLNRMLPIEAMRLAEDDLEPVFYKRYLDRGLAQYKLDGNQPKGRGPVICAIDCSGSMAGIKDEWSKAVAIAMYWIARKQKRQFYFLLFNTRVEAQGMFEPGKPDADLLAGLMSRGCGGGTAFDPPLLNAMAVRDESMADADIVFITDGQASISDEVRREFERNRKETSLMTILIGPDAARGGGITALSDDVFPLDIRAIQEAIESGDSEVYNKLFKI